MIKYAAQYFMRIRNKLLHKQAGFPNQGKYSPDLLWEGKVQNFSRELPFGCQVTIHQLEDQRNGKWDQPGIPGIFLGMIGSSIYEVYNMKSRRIVKAFHILALRDRFPGLKKPLKNDFVNLTNPLSHYAPVHKEMNQTEINSIWPENVIQLSEGVVEVDDTPEGEEKQPNYNLRPREVPSYVPIQGSDDTNFEIPYEAENSVDSSGIETNDEENNSIEINKENVDETIEELIEQVPEIIIYVEEDEKEEFDDDSDTSTVDIEEGNSSSENPDKEFRVHPEPDKVNRIQ